LKQCPPVSIKRWKSGSGSGRNGFGLRLTHARHYQSV